MSSLSSFPSGLRVLVVDDDAPTLKVVSAMLQKCAYQVTAATSGKEALTKLRDKSQQQFDLVLSDVMMPDMDGFRLLELIGLELDLPVIMMSSNGETHTVLRGVTHGAVDFLIKPVRLEELRNLWQHVVRRRRDMVKDESEDHSGEREEQACEMAGKKRKEHAIHTAIEMHEDDASASKKARVVWSVEMHQQFVNAVNQLGVDKAVPKKILEIMQVDGLTRENVASHLQKYRLYLKRVATVGQGAPAQGSAGPAGASTSGLVSAPSMPNTSAPPSTSGRGAKAMQNGHTAPPAGAPQGAASAPPQLPEAAAAAAASAAADATAAANLAAANQLAAANMAAAAGFPNPMLNPMAAMMNTPGGMNPLLGGMNPLNPMGMLPGMPQNSMPMGLPNIQVPGLPMPMPFMQGMGVMPGMLPQGMPPVFNMPGSAGSTSSRQGSGNLAIPATQQQQQQQQQMYLQQQQQLQRQQQMQQASGSSSGGSGCSTQVSGGHMFAAGGMNPGTNSGTPSPGAAPPVIPGLQGLGDPAVGMGAPHLALGPSLAPTSNSGAPAGVSGSGGPAGLVDDALFFDHSELAAAFDGLYNGTDDLGIPAAPAMQPPLLSNPAGMQACTPVSSTSDPLLMLTKQEDDMQLEGKALGVQALGLATEPGAEGMDDLINFFLKN